MRPGTITIVLCQYLLIGSAREAYIKKQGELYFGITLLICSHPHQTEKLLQRQAVNKMRRRSKSVGRSAKTRPIYVPEFGVPEFGFANDRARRERPCSRRTAEKRDELAPTCTERTFPTACAVKPPHICALTTKAFF